MLKYKDEITNVCGLVVTVGGALMAAPVVMPVVVKTTIIVLMAIAGGTIGYLSGKVPQ